MENKMKEKFEIKIKVEIEMEPGSNVWEEMAKMVEILQKTPLSQNIQEGYIEEAGGGSNKREKFSLLFFWWEFG